MSYITCQLPKIQILREHLDDSPNRIVYYAKYDTFMGDMESIEYITKKIAQYYKK